jgi:hypothetical protein
MIVFINSEGTATQIVPTPIYQNSALDGKLFVVAPFPTATAVQVAFRLPNGIVTTQYPMAAINDNGINSEQLPELIMSLRGNFGVWQYTTKNALITKYAGDVTAQFQFLHAENENVSVLASSATTFNVLRGVVSLDTATPSADQWDAVVTLLAEANSKLTYKTVVNVQTNVEEGKIVVSYSDGSVESIDYPVQPSEGKNSNNLVVIEFTEASFGSLPNEGVFFIQPKALTSDDYIVMLEREAQQKLPAENSQVPTTTKNGYSTLTNEVFIGEDGTLYFEDAVAFNGRILAISKAIIDDFQPAYETIFDLTSKDEIYINELESGIYRVKGTTKIYYGNGVEDYTIASVDVDKINLLNVIRSANTETYTPLWCWWMFDNSNGFPSIECGTTTESGENYKTTVIINSPSTAIETKNMLTQNDVQQSLVNSVKPIASQVVNSEVNRINSVLDGLEHFRGTFASTSQILALPNPKNGDFAYNDETLTKWVFNGLSQNWENSNISIPDTIVPKSNTVPLMDGTASVGSETSYASGDHRHPHDTSKQDVLTFDSVPTQGSSNPVTSGGVYNALQNAGASIPIEKVGF